MMPKQPTQRDPDQQARRKRYTSSAWRKARAAFLKQHPQCVDCGRPATIVDHSLGHSDIPVPGGDAITWRELFWIKEGWQARCQSCHSRMTVARGEVANGPGGFRPAGSLQTGGECGRGRGGGEFSRGDFFCHVSVPLFFSGQVLGQPTTARTTMEQALAVLGGPGAIEADRKLIRAGRRRRLPKGG